MGTGSRVVIYVIYRRQHQGQRENCITTGKKNLILPAFTAFVRSGQLDSIGTYSIKQIIDPLYQKEEVPVFIFFWYIALHNDRNDSNRNWPCFAL